MEKKTDPCEDTRYIVFATDKKPQGEVDGAIGHLQVCKDCRTEIPAEDRAKFVSGAAHGREESLGGNVNNAAVGSGSRASKRAPAPYPMPKPHDTDVPEAS